MTYLSVSLARSKRDLRLGFLIPFCQLLNACSMSSKVIRDLRELAFFFAEEIVSSALELEVFIHIPGWICTSTLGTPAPVHSGHQM